MEPSAARSNCLGLGLDVVVGQAAGLGLDDAQ
jgi:hypothetical protein